MAKEKSKKIFKEIEIPNGVNVKLEDNMIIVKKDSDELKRKLNELVKVERKENKIIVSVERITKRERKMIGTTVGHIKNMIQGVQEKFVYKLQIVSVHFPINFSIDKEKNEAVIKNFLGERKDRKIKVIEGVEIKPGKEIIEIESINKEAAGQMAANLEKATKVRNKDRRIYQDGIFIIEKPGRRFL